MGLHSAWLRPTLNTFSPGSCKYSFDQVQKSVYHSAPLPPSRHLYRLAVVCLFADLSACVWLPSFALAVEHQTSRQHNPIYQRREQCHYFGLKLLFQVHRLALYRPCNARFSQLSIASRGSPKLSLRLGLSRCPLWSGALCEQLPSLHVARSIE